MFLALNEDSDAVRQDIEYFMTDLDAAIDEHIAIETHVWISPDRVTAGCRGWTSGWCSRPRRTATTEAEVHPRLLPARVLAHFARKLYLSRGGPRNKLSHADRWRLRTRCHA